MIIWDFCPQLVRDCEVAATKCDLCLEFGHEPAECPMLRKARKELQVEKKKFWAGYWPENWR